MCIKEKPEQNNIFECMIYIVCLALVVFFLSFLSTGYISYILKLIAIVTFIYLSGLLYIYKYFKESLFLKRVILYVGIFPILFFTSVIISNIFVINPNSASSVISTIVQSDAAILAIYITLSLVAVQQASSSYSPRVMKIFSNKEKNPDFWILVTIYILSIIYGLLILSQIDGSYLFTVKDNNLIIELFRLQNHFKFICFLGSYTFVILLPNIKNTLNLLDPFYIIDLLSSEITKEGILDFCFTKRANSEDKLVVINPFLPILDIIRASINSQDNETSVKGIETIENKVMCIIEKTNQEEGLIVSKHFIENMSVVLQLALKNNGEQSVSQIIRSVGKLTKTSQIKGMGKIRTYSLELLNKMITDIIESKMDQATSNLALVFLEIGELSYGHDDYIKDECVRAIKLIIDRSIDYSLFSAIMDINTSLKSSILQKNVGLDFEKLKNGYRIGNKKYIV